jgi:hypothetical protein
MLGQESAGIVYREGRALGKFGGEMIERLSETHDSRQNGDPLSL